MRRLPPLAGLRAFEAAARHLSFKRAADELHVTPTAISHQVRQLEQTVGVRLFERRTRQVLLTAEGQVLLPVLRDGFDAFARVLEGLSRKRRRAVVTLSATPAFTAKWLVPRLAGLRKSRADIDLTLLASLEVADLNSTADLALRYGSGPYPDLIAEPLTVDRFAPVVSPRLGIRRPSDLRSATLLHFDWHRRDARNPTWRRWLKTAGINDVDARAGVRFSDETHAIQATVAGAGVALHSLVLVADELSQGTLVAPFGPELEGFSLHLVRSRDRPLTEPVEAVRHWLKSEFDAAR
ncbi:LysR family transcriptional regulator [Bradyrhizobium sp. IC3123]|uniref:LysR substrate-binding domain-containing protein n=1 Tax=Bradyrhizobium sp. IC3123 TaxID=2793803 RepID=UPI0023DF2F70|nr:LysR substrate-binding domain-containing protein [Bradyrhizobium sp. IC3123]MCA1388725.1 LysR family transcriptional regulator [Bradyrhizobium sp. IC3123]